MTKFFFRLSGLGQIYGLPEARSSEEFHRHYGKEFKVSLEKFYRMGNPVKFIVAGYGLIGNRHAAIVQNHPQAELTAIVEIDSAKRKEAAMAFKVPVHERLDDIKLPADVVCVCTSNDMHAPLAMQALAHKFHVVIEKPMALTKADCEQIIFKSLNESRNVFVVKQNRYSPPSKWLKSLVEQSILGKIFMVQINCYWNRDERYYKKGDWRGSLSKDGGTLFTQFSHFVDTLYWMFGDIRNIQARFRNFSHQGITEFEDSGIVSFEFVNGGIGCINFSTSCWDKNMESSMTVIGENGSVKVGGQYMNEVEYCHVKNYRMPRLEPTNPPNDYGPYKGSAANHHYVIQNVIDTLNGKSSIDTNAMEGLKVVEIIEHIYEQRDLIKILPK